MTRLCSIFVLGALFFCQASLGMDYTTFQDHPELNQACKDGNIHFVREFLDLDDNDGDYLNTIKDAFGFTPLMYAVNNGHISIVQLLLSAGADLSAKNKMNQTALHIAQSKGNALLISLLQNYDISYKGMIDE